jgi:hypothetical protein
MAIRSPEEAAAYLSTPPLSSNLAAIMQAAGDRLEEGVTPRKLMGIDAPRLEASARFMEMAARREGDAEVRRACFRVLRLMDAEISPAAKAADEEASAASGKA